MIKKFFKLDEHGSTIAREFLAGVTMVYIVVVNPKILEAAVSPLDLPWLPPS
jgi:adenine/guanine/hypoxanthine permease